MITVYYVYKRIDGKWYATSKTFNNKLKCLRFLYAIRKKGCNIEWSCDDPYDNQWLNQNFRG